MYTRIHKSNNKSAQKNIDDTIKFERYPQRNSEKSKVDLARCLVLANKNSPLSLRIKNTTTLGRNCADFLKWSKFKDYDFYESIDPYSYACALAVNLCSMQCCGFIGEYTSSFGYLHSVADGKTISKLFTGSLLPINAKPEFDEKILENKRSG